MSVEWFDLGQRLRAASAGTVVPRLSGAPVLAAAHPVAVQITGTGRRSTVHAAAPGTGPLSAPADAALSLLGSLGVTITAASPATLVTDSEATVGQLLDLARATSSPGTPADDVAAHIAWWDQQADFPGGRGVVNLSAACRARWVTGELPQAERHLTTWRAWLELDDETVVGLLDLYARVAAGAPLDFLTDLGESAIYAWLGAQRQHGDGWDWRHPDTPARAAIGLRARCDAADLFAAALLGDPLYRLRAVHTGHVVTGVASPVPVPAGQRSRHWTVLCDRLDTRLRPDNDVLGWAGSPTRRGATRFRCKVSSAVVTGRGLVLGLDGMSGAALAPGASITLIPFPPAVMQQMRGQRTYRGLYASRWSWLTTGNTPTLTRRDVPLSLLVAAAEPPKAT